MVTNTYEWICRRCSRGDILHLNPEDSLIHSLVAVHFEISPNCTDGLAIRGEFIKDPKTV